MYDPVQDVAKKLYANVGIITRKRMTLDNFANLLTSFYMVCLCYYKQIISFKWKTLLRD